VFIDRSAAAVPPVIRPSELFLVLVGFFGGTAHDLPSFMYVGGGIGPFDWLVLALLLRWVLFSPRTLDKRAMRMFAPFFVFAAFAYVGEICGALRFEGTNAASIIAPIRYLSYPTMFFTLVPLVRSERDLKILFSAYVFGVLALAALAVMRSPDPSFFFGLPVLYDPNVVGNFVGYALICLGLSFMPRSATSRIAMLFALFTFAMFTFSKASWVLALLGLYINAATMNKWRLAAIIVVAAMASLAFVDWGHVLTLATDAIDVKLASSVGSDQSGGTFYMRLGYFISSAYALVQYPLGIGLRNSPFVNDTYARALGNLYFPTDSPHTAVGFVCAQAGWVGLAVLAVVFRRVASSLRSMYAARDIGTSSVVAVMLLVSVFFQIEFFTQPFIYLVLAAAIARHIHSCAGLQETLNQGRAPA